MWRIHKKKLISDIDILTNIYKKYIDGTLVLFYFSRSGNPLGADVYYNCHCNQIPDPFYEKLLLGAGTYNLRFRNL